MQNDWQQATLKAAKANELERWPIYQPTNQKHSATLTGRPIQHRYRH